MPTKRFSQIIKDLSFEKKIIAGGALLLAISLFLPWYQDVDTFRTGDTFTGLNGPLYLVGFSFLILASTTLLFLVSNQINLKLPLVSTKASKLYLGYGILSFYLLMVVNSVYFHPDFGVNITLKESGFGMFIAFIAAALLTIGGYLNIREKTTNLREFEEEVSEPVIKVPSLQQKPKENLRTVYPNTAKPLQPNAEQDTREFDLPKKTAESDKSAQTYRMDL